MTGLAEKIGQLTAKSAPKVIRIQELLGYIRVAAKHLCNLD
jgi:hypothetical protein